MNPRTDRFQKQRRFWRTGRSLLREGIPNYYTGAFLLSPETTAQVSFPCAPTEAVCSSRETTFTTRVRYRNGYYPGCHHGFTRVEREIEMPSDFCGCSWMSGHMTAMEHRRVSQCSFWEGPQTPNSTQDSGMQSGTIDEIHCISDKALRTTNIQMNCKHTGSKGRVRHLSPPPPPQPLPPHVPGGIRCTAHQQHCGVLLTSRASGSVLWVQ